MNNIPVAFEATIVTVNDKAIVMFMTLKKIYLCNFIPFDISGDRSF
jgi:hypothetical protein